MKRSAAVVLVLSGSLLAGCGRREEPQQTAQKPSQTLTNDTYVEGRGYYHAPFGGFFPFPYNFHSPGAGFYRGGSYHQQPDTRVHAPTAPGRAAASVNTGVRSAENVNRGGFTRGVTPGRSFGG